MPKVQTALFALLAIMLCGIVGVYAELFIEFMNSMKYDQEISLLVGKTGLSTIAHIGLYTLIAIGLVALAYRFRERLGSFLFKWRYPLSLALLIILVIFQVSGSSLGMWAQCSSGKGLENVNGLLFGIPRYTRSDEWLVLIPQAFSQAHTGYSAISDIIRGVPTDVTMVYAQPSWAIATFFRPFLWGYLFLGSSYGLSFFWCGRLIVLFLVSFEFGRLITNDRRAYALAYALFVSFAPLVQWWFAVNGTAELLIFGQGLILAFAGWNNASNMKTCMGFSLLFAYCAGVFILVIYPAWQVGLGYVIAGLAIAVLTDKGNDRFDRKAERGSAFGLVPRLGCLFTSLAALGILLIIIFWSSLDTIRAVSNTEYPGNRVSLGGGYLPFIMLYVSSWFAPTVVPELCLPNPSEFSSFFTLFPLGIILGAISLFYKRDSLIIALIVIYIAMLTFGLFGFPEWLAKITLLSHVITQRLQMPLGFIETILLIRSCVVLSSNRKHVRNQAFEIIASAIIALAFSAIVTGYFYWILQPQLSNSRLLPLLSFMFVASSVFAFLQDASPGATGKHIVLIATVVAITGLCVNPIQLGSHELTDSDLSKDITGVLQSDNYSQDDLWVSDSFILSQILIANGAPTLNSTAVYPSLETWHKIDKDRSYESVYNRYAHIIVNPSKSDDPNFTLVQDDLFSVDLNPRNLKALGITYWVSSEDLTAYDCDIAQFNLVSSSHNGLSIYHITYK